MTDVRWKQRFANFRRALDRLGQAVELQNLRPLTELEAQGLIQLIDKRNLSSHSYNVQVAQSVVQAVLFHYYPAFRALERRLLGEG